MMPMPTPAPIEPSPAPTPSAIAFPASVMPVSVIPLAWAMRSTMNELLRFLTHRCLVTRGGRASQVDSGEDREDECQRERERPQRSQPEEHREAAGHEQDQQVAGEDVREQTH